MDQQLTSELIESIRLYLSNQMQDEERQLFEQRMTNEPWLAQEVSQFQALQQGLNAIHLQEMKSQLTQWETERKAQAPSTTRDVRPFWQKASIQYMAIAAALALLLAIGGIFYVSHEATDSYESLLAMELAEVPNPNLLRGGSATLDSTVVWYRQGVVHYVAGEYESAIQTWNKCMLVDSLSAEANRDELSFFLGISHVKLGQTDQAIRNLQQVNADTRFFPSAEYYLALAGMQANDTTMTLHQLERISQESAHPYAEKSQQLLQALQE
ncbi:MAG: hypothetical protein AAF399_16390 [Bacteroidota bacterium]